MIGSLAALRGQISHNVSFAWKETVKDKLTIRIHMVAEKYCAEGVAQLLVAPKDYVMLREFFAKDFRVVETAVSPDGGTSYLVEYQPREVGE